MLGVISNCGYHQVRYRGGFKKHLDNLNPNGDFTVLYAFGIVSQVSGIILYHLTKYHLKTDDTMSSNLTRKRKLHPQKVL
jgi:hypothetical protein